MQKGIIGKKLGMTQLFDEHGKVVPCDRHRGWPLHRCAEENCRERWLL